MGTKRAGFARSVLVLLIIGTLSAAQQVSSESVFSAGTPAAGSLPQGPRLVLNGPPAPAAGTTFLSSTSAPPDTVETFDVQVEEEKGSSLWKQLAVFGVITAVAAYAVYSLVGKDDEPAPTGGGGSGKPTPDRLSAAAISLPLTR